MFSQKGFPADKQLDELLKFFDGADIGCVKAVRMRYTNGKPRKFKGSVFVDLGSEAEVAAVVSKGLSYEGKPLIVRQKSEYLAEKRKEFEARRAERKRQREEQAGDAAGETVDRSYEKGTCLKVEGLGETCDRETLKAAFSTCGEIEWVLYQRGEKIGHIMFKEAGKAPAAVEKLFADGVPECAGTVPTVSCVEGDDEKTQWEAVWAVQDSFASRKKRHKNGGGH